MIKGVTIVHIITGLSDGGAEGVLYRLCRNDHAHRHLVISLSDSGKYGQLLEPLGVSVITMQMAPGRPAPIAFIRLVRLLRQHKPDVVQTWMYHADLFGGLAARLAGIQSVVWGIRKSTLEPGKSKKTTIWIAKILSKLSWWLPSRIAVCAQRAMEEHEELGYNRDIMRFIPNGYDLSDFQPELDPDESIRSSLRISSSIPLIGTVGRFHPQKNHANLLEALAVIKSRNISFNCILVGTGLNDRNTVLVDMIGELGLNNDVRLLGRRNDIPQVMNALDLHVLPSSSEGFPNVVAEAMACETPCVVTDVGDAAYIVGDTGWVVPPKNSSALADTIITAMDELDSPDWRVRCKAARTRVEKYFSIEQMVKSYSELWSEVKER